MTLFKSSTFFYRLDYHGVQYIMKIHYIMNIHQAISFPVEFKVYKKYYNLHA